MSKDDSASQAVLEVINFLTLALFVFNIAYCTLNSLLHKGEIKI